MLIKTLNGWNLAEYTVRYTHRGEEVEQIVGEEGKEWWLDFAEKWEDTNIVEFTDMVYTEEQLARLEEIKNLDIADNIANEYVMDGIIGAGMEVFALEKENAKLRGLLADLTEVVLLGGAQ